MVGGAVRSGGVCVWGWGGGLTNIRWITADHGVDGTCKQSRTHSRRQYDNATTNSSTNIVNNQWQHCRLSALRISFSIDKSNNRHGILQAYSKERFIH